MIENDIVREIGSNIVGPFLVNFCRWLYNEQKVQKIDTLVFLSRDGYLLKQIYETLYPQEIFKCKYISVSRKSLRLPYICHCSNFEDFIKVIPPFISYTIQAFVNSICSIDDVVLPPEIELSHSCRRKLMHLDQMFKRTYLIVRNQLLEEAKKQEYLLKRYFHQQRILGNVGLIDFSYKGTSQFFLEKIFKNDDISFFGLYYCVNEICKARLKDRFSSFSNKYIGRSDTFVFCCDKLLERLVFERTGSTVKYCLLDGIVEPVKNSADLKNDPIVLPIQKEILLYTQNNKKEHISDRESIKRVLRLLKYPRRDEALYLGKIRDDDIRYSSRFLANPRDLSEYLLNPRALYRDLCLSRWRQGFLSLLPCGRIWCVFYNILIDWGYASRRLRW